MNGLRVVVVVIAFGCSAVWAAQEKIADYRQALRLFWSELYVSGGNTLYCGQRFGRGRHDGINIEHVLPMSWVMNELGCDERDQCRRQSRRFNTIEADLHNLYPALIEINEARGSFPFGEIKGETQVFSGCDFEIDYRKRLVEPRAASRGEIARAMLYMHETYDIPMFTRLGITLKRWNRQDPASSEERRRNDAIEQLQGTRNRFIDDPRAADELWF